MARQTRESGERVGVFAGSVTGVATPDHGAVSFARFISQPESGSESGCSKKILLGADQASGTANRQGRQSRGVRSLLPTQEMKYGTYGTKRRGSVSAFQSSPRRISENNSYTTLRRSAKTQRASVPLHKYGDVFFGGIVLVLVLVVVLGNMDPAGGLIDDENEDDDEDDGKNTSQELRMGVLSLRVLRKWALSIASPLLP